MARDGEAEGAQGFRGDGHMPDAARFQPFEVLDRGGKQLLVRGRHGFIVTARR